MKILLVLAHPEPQSMNGALFTSAIETLQAAGHEVKTSDLYAMHFNPVSDSSNFTVLQNPSFFKQQQEELYATQNQSFSPEIEAEQQKVEWCDLMIWQFPLWWFSVPGILKGWVDRVFAMGRFYQSGRIYENGVFKEKKAMLSLTTGTDTPAYMKDGLQGDIYNILKPIHRGILTFTGFGVLQPHIVYGPVRMTPEMRDATLVGWRARLNNIFKENVIPVGGY